MDIKDDVPPTGYLPCSPALLESGVDCATAPRWSCESWDGHSHWHPMPPDDPTSEWENTFGPDYVDESE